ncbi:DUF3999 family protein [Aquimarina sp. RZ0]|uniref:DUF3999 family protein n=1 Tax=Aquimarina sp. RZ0 TaxID=2607730 RepID=UPI0011F1764B|nr:DUF3999 family protein [Aquimarina sp. RZ0]KAA1243914.1 DUF3999 family protein [Aquimarina sp. RZ0]
MRSKINNIVFILFLYCLCSYGQIDTYSYKRQLTGISNTWHRIALPDEIFKRLSSDLSDIRIYGITKENDTIEAPYLLKQNQEKRSGKEVNFEIINQSITAEGSFITLKIPYDQVINQIKLFFEEENFDNLVNIEGSQNLKNWFTIVESYRILSIKNELTNYAFTRIKIPSSKYQYFRVFIKGTKAPEVKNAQMTLVEVEEASYKTYDIKSIHTQEQKQNHRTVIDIDLKTSTPVSYIKIRDANDFDYYRPLRIAYLSDSAQTKKGWIHTYRNLTSGILNSIEDNEFRFRSVIAEKLRIVIDNQDNEPLAFDAISVKGYTHELIARFTTPATYYLTYGNPAVRKPSYDLKYIYDVTSEDVKTLRIGAEEAISKNKPETVLPLFKNEIWLWVVMLIVIGLLGGFTLMMMKKK